MPNINKNIIMQAGPAVANAANKAAGLTAATPEPGSMISVIQLVNGGRTIGPDALAHFTESVRNKLLSLLVSMEPIQDFNGYGHPWPAGGGKNKCSLADQTFERSNEFEVDEIPAGTYIYSAVITSTDTDATQCSVVFLDSGKNTLASKAIDRSVGGSRVSTTSFTVPSPIKYIRLYASTSYPAGAGDTATFTDNMVCLSTESDPTVYAPYSNICPISGRTGLSVYVGPTIAIGDAATYSMDWTSPAGTVYAGSADIVTGDIKAAPYYASYNGETLAGPWVSSMDVYDPEGTPTTGAQVVDLGGTMTEYNITGQDIITLVGDNYIWSDSGDVTITE